jgi:hypothetical protein
MWIQELLTLRHALSDNLYLVHRSRLNVGRILIWLDCQSSNKVFNVVLEIFDRGEIERPHEARNAQKERSFRNVNPLAHAAASSKNEVVSFLRVTNSRLKEGGVIAYEPFRLEDSRFVGPIRIHVDSPIAIHV